jgi:hypothetical protein
MTFIAPMFATHKARYYLMDGRAGTLPPIAGGRRKRIPTLGAGSGRCRRFLAQNRGIRPERRRRFGH